MQKDSSKPKKEKDSTSKEKKDKKDKDASKDKKPKDDKASSKKARLLYFHTYVVPCPVILIVCKMHDVLRY